MFQPDFLDKEAKFGLPGAITSKVHKTVTDSKRAADPDNVELFSQRKVNEGVQDRIRQDGNGLFGDMAIGATKFLTPKSWDVKEKILKPVDRFKGKVDEISTKAAGKIIGDKPDKSLTAKFFSTPDPVTLGRQQLPDGSYRAIQSGDRKASLTAPLQNTAKVTAPILGSMYVAEKMYPAEEVDQAEKRAFEEELLEEKNGLEDELLTERLDKKAALDKVAHLEDELEKLSYELSEVEAEKNLFWKKAESESMEKQAALREKGRLEDELSKQASVHEEYRLRTNAKARSGNAVKLAEEMLENGLIKQAEYNEKVDFLMDCDDKTFNLHSSLIKTAKNEEKGLETSPYMIDYRSKDEESSSRRARPGVNKKGQTIGEAAKDLKK